MLQPTELLFVPAEEYYHIFDEMNFADENQSMQRSPQVRCNFKTAPAKISSVLDFHLQVKIKLIFKKIGSKYKTRYRKNFWNHVKGKIRWCIRESGKITFLYVFGATDWEPQIIVRRTAKKKESLLQFIYHGKKPERWPKTDVVGGLFLRPYE